MSYLLLAITVLSWGCSWYAITLQVAYAPPIVSVAYRFALAGIVLLGALAITGHLRVIPRRDHIWVAALGATFFSLNFICYYTAADDIPSGVMSVIFATAAIIGAINQRVFLGVPLDMRVMVAAAIGVTGLVLLIGPEAQSGGRAVIGALALCFLGTWFFSVGGLISSRVGARYAMPNVAGQGMLYGVLICSVIAAIRGDAFVVPSQPVFWYALLFLAIVSSVIAFVAYLALIRREGPIRASYATVLFPVIAMALSGLLEGYVWTWTSVFGLALTLIGTIVVFSRKSP
ncbi:MAG: DMT family transporter [Roseovarius sp.]